MFGKNVRLLKFHFNSVNRKPTEDVSSEKEINETHLT